MTENHPADDSRDFVAAPSAQPGPTGPLPEASADLPEQVRVRLGKREALREAGVDPYPVGFPRTATIAEIRAAYAGLPPDTATGDFAGVVGRVMLSRIGGKLCFATIRDGTGDIQVMISLAKVGEQALAAWKRDVDLGDHVGVQGEVITSRSGELSVLADSFAITAKSLRPLPDKHKGLSDIESRVRQRYVDLIVNPDARRMARLRSDVVHAIREDMYRRGFVEVETPVLQAIHGGANARPFVTHGNAYDSELYLRIALELYLKRLVVGGIENVYEIGRVFRNEGVDTTHNPEFTMLEAYQAYGDYDTVAVLTRELIQNAARTALGSTLIRARGRQRARHRGGVAGAHCPRRHLRSPGRGNHARHAGGGAPQALCPGGGPGRARLEPRPGRAGDV